MKVKCYLNKEGDIETEFEKEIYDKRNNSYIKSVTAPIEEGTLDMYLTLGEQWRIQEGETIVKRLEPWFIKMVILA